MPTLSRASGALWDTETVRKSRRRYENLLCETNEVMLCEQQEWQVAFRFREMVGVLKTPVWSIFPNRQGLDRSVFSLSESGYRTDSVLIYPQLDIFLMH